MTSTSGPGISLMQEAVGLAGMSETPVVVVDVMRGGPSTGLPTKTEQSDLNELIFGTHGEIPRIVLTPATVEDCFYMAVEAFNLAERYQCPVYLVSDLSLGMSRQSIDGLDYSRVRIDRGALISQEELDAMERGAYKRYLVTESGISPRSLPGMRNGRFVALGNEHDEAGTEEIEDTSTREIQMKKRMRKLDGLDLSDYVDYYGDEPADRVDLLVVGWGSTIGRIQEAVARLEADGYKVGHLHLRALYPFPKEKVRRYLAPRPGCWWWRTTTPASWRAICSGKWASTRSSTAAASSTATRSWPARSTPGHARCCSMAKVADFKAARPTWCPGCGDFGVLNALTRAVADLGLEPEEVVVVSGIGCSGKISQYFGSYGFHGIHGRALPIAQGVKLANRELTVIAAGGDGDGYGIGLSHVIHAIRRNVDLTYIVMDNHIYGLTTGQLAPTSDKGMKTKTSPYGSVEEPVRPLELALGQGCGFVAQAFSGEIHHMAEVFKKAIQHKGFSLVNVFSRA